MAYSESDLRQIIKDRCDREGRQTVADDLVITTAYISMLLRSDDPQPISKPLAEKMGFTLKKAVQKVFVPNKELA